MTDIDIAQELPVAIERPPPKTSGIVDWLKVNLFGSVFNTILTLLAVYLLVVTIPPVIRWALIDAVWSAPSGQACRGRVSQQVAGDSASRDLHIEAPEGGASLR